MTAKPRVTRMYFMDIRSDRLVPHWTYDHDTAECFSKITPLFDTMQQTFRGAHYHLREECETNDR